MIGFYHREMTLLVDMSYRSVELCAYQLFAFLYKNYIYEITLIEMKYNFCTIIENPNKLKKLWWR